jgi:hypothetical protein
MRLSYYWNAGKPIKVSVFIVFASCMIVSLCGATYDMSRDNLRDGTEITLRGFILEKQDRERVLVVEKRPSTDEREKRIYIFITRKTKIGYTVFGPTQYWKNVPYDHLKIEMTVLIKGLKVLGKNDRDIIRVKAESIELVE